MNQPIPIQVTLSPMYQPPAPIKTIKTNSVYLNTMYDILAPFMYEPCTKDVGLRIRRALFDRYPYFFIREIESGLFEVFRQGELNVPMKTSRMTPVGALEEINWFLGRYDIGNSDANLLVFSMFEYYTSQVIKSGVTITPHILLFDESQLECEGIFYDANFSV